MNAIIALSEKLSCCCRPCVAISLIDFEKFLYAKHNEVRHLDHRMLSRVDRITKFDDVFYPLGRHNFETTVSGNGSNIGLELLLLVNDYDATGGPTQSRFYVLIHDRCHVVECQ